MINRFKNIAGFILVVSFLPIASIILSSCMCVPCHQREETQVPYDVLQKSNEFIIAKTGEQFFKKYITPDFTRTKKDSTGYLMVYQMFDPDRPYVDDLIHFSTDTLGNVDTLKDVIGIPDCKDNPELGNFSLNEEEAIKTAKEFGLPKGIKDWKTGFLWDQKYQQYVWHVLSVTEENKKNGVYSGKGKEIIIDPASGNVLETNDWHIN